MTADIFWSPTTTALRPQPPIPNTGWAPPAELPDLHQATCIAVDTETYDPGLLDYGPGWGRAAGHIVGVSIAAKAADGSVFKCYLPLRHEVEAEDNLDIPRCVAWLKSVLETPSIPKVGANLQYDIGWLETEGIYVAGELVDVQFAGSLLTEGESVALDYLGQKYLGRGKDTVFLYQWCADYYGGPVSSKQRANIYRTPPRLCGPYAEEDALLPLELAAVLYPKLRAGGLLDVFEMENGLIPLFVKMRHEGVRVDVEKAEILHHKMGLEIAQHHRDLRAVFGFEVNVSAPASMSKVFSALGIRPGVSPKGGDSYAKGVLAEHASVPAVGKILTVRKLEKTRGTFIESYILAANVNGRVHGSFHQLKKDVGGARSGRMSSSNPNLQNITSRDEVWAPLIRGLYVPDDGHVAWRKNDLSQIEYRILAHTAVGGGAEEVRALYASDPHTDYHTAAQDLVKEVTGLVIPRKPIKNVNFGVIYGMSAPTLCKLICLASGPGNELLDAYHAGAPYVKATMAKYSSIAAETGEIVTLMGRKSYFNKWVPSYRVDGDRPVGLPLADAQRKWGTNLERADLHKPMNRFIQGSAADQLKKALWLCWTTGIFDATGVPRNIVHDEINWSVPDYSPEVTEGFRAAKHAMETSIPMRVPIIADCEIGADWGNVIDYVDGDVTVYTANAQ